MGQWRVAILSAFAAFFFLFVRSGDQGTEQNTQLSGGATEGTGKQDKLVVSGAKTSQDADKQHGRGAPPAGSAKPASSPPKGQEVQQILAQWETSVVSSTEPVPLPERRDHASDPLGLAAHVPGDRIIDKPGESLTSLTTDAKTTADLPVGPDFSATVQKELARLGCYRGAIDNIWGPLSRGAVGQFNQMAGTSLQIRRPTPVALKEFKRYPDRFCAGGSVAKGQGAQIAGRTPAGEPLPSYLPPWMRGDAVPAQEPAATTNAPSHPARTNAPRRTSSVPARPAHRAKKKFVGRKLRRADSRRRRVRRRRSRRQPSFVRQRSFQWPWE